jgi:hypothetical protein
MMDAQVSPTNAVATSEIAFFISKLLLVKKICRDADLMSGTLARQARNQGFLPILSIGLIQIKPMSDAHSGTYASLKNSIWPKNKFFLIFVLRRQKK